MTSPRSVTGTRRTRPPVLLFSLLLSACLLLATVARAADAGGRPPDRDSERVGRSYPTTDLRGFQWWLDEIVDTGRTTPPSIGGASPRLAIVTPGINRNHPDLDSLDIVGAESLGRELDRVGTSVAGIAASPGDGSGIVGVWPGMKLRHAGSGTGTCEEAADAIFDVAGKPGRVRVILLAYSFDGPSCARHLAATQYAVSRGLLLVAPTGDSISPVSVAGGPAADPHVLGVGAVDEARALADFSVTGSAVDLVAPGEQVFAPDLLEGNGSGAVPGYDRLDGTVYAAAIVAAAASLVSGPRDRLWRSQLEAVLAGGAEDLGPNGRDQSFGAGLIQVEGALGAPAPVADKLEPNDDIGWLDGRLLTDGRRPVKATNLWPSGGRKARKLQATLSPGDPADVYRIVVPPRTKMVIGVAQAEGDVGIDVRKQGPARTIANERGRFGSSDLPAPKTEGLEIRNPTRKARAVYLVIRLGRESTSDTARYQVTVPVRRTLLRQA